jgi:hypothetical protein
MSLITARVEFAVPHISIVEFLHLDKLRDCDDIYIPLCKWAGQRKRGKYVDRGRKKTYEYLKKSNSFEEKNQDVSKLCY